MHVLIMCLLVAIIFTVCEKLKSKKIIGKNNKMKMINTGIMKVKKKKTKKIV